MQSDYLSINKNSYLASASGNERSCRLSALVKQPEHCGFNTPQFCDAATLLLIPFLMLIAVTIPFDQTPHLANVFLFSLKLTTPYMLYVFGRTLFPKWTMHNAYAFIYLRLIIYISINSNAAAAVDAVLLHFFVLCRPAIFFFLWIFRVFGLAISFKSPFYYCY